MTGTRAGGFEDLVTMTGDRMLRTAVLLTGDRHEAEDLVQSAYAQAFARWRLVARAENPVAYVRTILTRLFLADRRRRRVGQVAWTPGADVAADVSADLPTLLATSRRQGLALRRRRRVLASVGATVAMAALAGGGYAVAATAGHGSHPTPGWAAVSPGRTLTLGATAPLTGRSLAAALASAVDQVAAGGSFTAFRGAVPNREEAMAEFLFTPQTDGVPGQVHLDLVDLASTGLASSHGCDQPYMHDCSSQQLPDGDTLCTYTDLSSGSARASHSYVAEVLSPRRDLQLILSASNANLDQRYAAQPDPVLSPTQLRTIVLQPWWSLTRLPAEYVAAGHRLPSYTGLDLSGD